jgi:hypothetical protein
MVQGQFGQNYETLSGKGWGYDLQGDFSASTTTITKAPEMTICNTMHYLQARRDMYM